MDEEVAKLKRVCDTILADTSLCKKKDGTTFCNVGVNRIARLMGLDGFYKITETGQELMMANDIFEYLNSNWPKVQAKWACEFAKSGGLAIAAIKGNPHGHVAVLYPADSTYSGKWREECPQVANIGNKNGVMGANYAFAEKPAYFVSPQKKIQQS